MNRIQSLALVPDIATGSPLTNPVASEIGVLLIIVAIGFMVGFLLRRVLGALRLVSLVIIAIILLAWAGGVAINTSNIPAVLDLLSLVRPICDVITQHVTWTPLRAGVAVTGFVVGICADLRARRSA